MTYPKHARAFVPGHITGMFRIHDDSENLLHCGSTGAGFCIMAGTVTSVEMKKNERFEVEVRYNSELIDGPVTKAVIRKLVDDYELKCKVRVHHDSALPIGVGWGASGAGALGTAIAATSLISKDITPYQAASYAHVAEVENHTGLGDVIAQFMGGFEIRHRPGPPGIGEITNLTYDEEYHVVLAGGIGLETGQVLTNDYQKTKINTFGDRRITELMENPTVETFIDCSRLFSSETGLETSRVHSALVDLDSNEIKSGMVMLGDSLFCLCSESEVSTAVGILSLYWSEHEVLVTSIANDGGRLL